MNHSLEQKPLIYSCSGCSSAAQMANHLAIKIDRSGSAEMSCIAGVGGNVKSLVKTANSGRKIIVLDGCPLACAKACLNNHNIAPDAHFDLTKFGVKKQKGVDFDRDEVEEVFQKLNHQLSEMQVIRELEVVE
ncbi:MAG TPA: putative zinc-binding protein [Niabella sp.]|nr:putative zinc-binding protein [Niabella sp.]HOZ96649.1 putative zinc-binding protein [Niabella sp.]HQW14483.1 putative zinc-binding protein [Niabella sp.]HQX19898.1 putative zinc-binding protein [Niabella sp.]HQX41505.1 putative zinc-binding protein [Niabella sp.]